MTPLFFDIIVLGGGPAGSCAALALANAGYRVALVDKGRKRSISIVESLPPAARPILCQLGLMDRFQAGPYLPCYGTQSAWGNDNLQCTDFIHDPNGLGWHLERTAFDTFLREAAQAAGVSIYPNTTPVEARRVTTNTAGNGQWHLTVKSAGRLDKFSAGWLLDCTGRASWLGRHLDVRRERHDRLVAFVGLFQQAAEFFTQKQIGAPSYSMVTVVESAPNGWWSAATIPGGKYAVTYFTDADDPTARAAKSRSGFLALLKQTRHINASFPHGGRALADDPFPLGAHTARLQTCVGDGWLAVGDAAISFDPLSAQGLFHALVSSLEAAETIAAFDTGDPNAPAEYAAGMMSVFTAYLRHHAYFYGIEHRWSSHAFWARRQTGQENNIQPSSN